MASLLEKTRKINRLLQRSENVEYDGISRVLSNVLNANVYITNKKGKIYGYAFVDDFECDLMIDKVIDQGEFPKHYVSWLMRMDETCANLRSKTGMCAYEENTKCLFNGKNTTIVPIYGVGERIGTLIVAKYDEEFDDDDLLLCEYGATVVAWRCCATTPRRSRSRRARRRRSRLPSTRFLSRSARRRSPFSRHSTVRKACSSLEDRGSGQDHALGHRQCTAQVRVGRCHLVEIARHEGHLHQGPQRVPAR